MALATAMAMPTNGKTGSQRPESNGIIAHSATP